MNGAHWIELATRLGTIPKSTRVDALNTCQCSCFAAAGPGCAKFGVSKCGMWDAIFGVQLFGWFWQLRHLNGHGILTMASKSPFANRRYCSSLRVSWGFLRFLLFEMEPGSLAKVTIVYLNNDFYPVLKHAVLFSFKSTWFWFQRMRAALPPNRLCNLMP